jgi:TrmH family RNA methyltransferase
MNKISSLQNPQIKKIIKLRKTSNRKDEGLIVVEGRQELEMACSAGIEFESLYFCPAMHAGKEKIDSLSAKDEYELDEEVFKKISIRETPDGFLGLAKPRIISLDQIRLSKTPLIIILEAVEKPGNLGAILRTADAAGVDAVILADPKTDIYNHNVIRSSLGTVFTNQVACGTFEEISQWLDKNDIRVLAATPSADSMHYDCDFKIPVALIIGNEHDGLSEKWLKKADLKVKIPMNGKIDSLNASVSAAVLVYEAVRQRR